MFVKSVSNRFAARVFLEEPRAINDIRASLEQRLEQQAVLIRIELEVGVLHQDDVAAREREAEANGRALAEIDRAMVNVHGQSGRPAARVDDAARAVGRSVVRDDDFLFNRAEIDSRDTIDDGIDRLLFVVNGNDHR